MFVTSGNVTPPGPSLPEVSTFRNGGPFVFKLESTQEPISSPGIPSSLPGAFHQLPNVIITPVASPSPSPSGISSPAISQDQVNTSHQDEAKLSPGLLTSGSLSPGSSPIPSSLPSPPLLSMGRVLTPRTDPTGCHENGISLLGNKYILLDQLEGSNLCRCIQVDTQQQFVCKSVSNDPAGRGMLSAHFRVDGHPNINPVCEVIVGDLQTYLLFPPCYTDLHSYVRTRRRLREPQARPLFRQIVSAVHEAHSKGIILRDLKLRKFVFADESRTELKLESLEDAVVLENDSDDLLSDKHGCPAYVSPEILKSNSQYSGRSADMWGLGVMLYTMLVGRYPFHGQEHTGLFAKIRRGHFSLPDTLSSRAKCLIRCLLRKEPEERLTTEDVLIHPWMTQVSNRERYRRTATTATVAATLTTTTPPPTAATATGSTSTASNWPGVSTGPTVLSGSGSSILPSSSYGYNFEAVDQLVPDCFMSDISEIEKN